jgi:hypothetical protein
MAEPSCQIRVILTGCFRGKLQTPSGGYWLAESQFL